jgi:hypothetical protein
MMFLRHLLEKALKPLMSMKFWPNLITSKMFRKRPGPLSYGSFTKRFTRRCLFDHCNGYGFGEGTCFCPRTTRFCQSKLWFSQAVGKILRKGKSLTSLDNLQTVYRAGKNSAKNWNQSMEISSSSYMPATRSPS